VKRVCVFCGSSPGGRQAYSETTTELARVLVDEGIGLVYGGAQVGLMGVLADEALAQGGEVIGVIPQALVDREIAHGGLSELRVVDSMHERKALMAELSDAFIALPGGLGTLDELFEVWTWAQLGMHRKPCALLDVEGYWASLTEFIDHSVTERFVREQNRDMLLVDDDPSRLLGQLREFDPGAMQPKWIDRTDA
jgi:uncharacterized protein (TIGR00730 family)